jgi:hypothetical protein
MSPFWAKHPFWVSEAKQKMNIKNQGEKITLIGLLLIVIGCILPVAGFDVPSPFSLNMVTYNTVVQDANTGAPISGASISGSATYTAGGYIPIGGSTDAAGHPVIDMTAAGSIVSWTVSKAGYTSKQGTGSFPSVISLVPTSASPTVTPSPTTAPTSQPTAAPTTSPTQDPIINTETPILNAVFNYVTLSGLALLITGWFFNRK